MERAHAQDRLEATQDYVRRGRNLEHLDTESLKRHWIAALTAWFSHRSQETTRGFDDAASELGLRGLVPEELIPREIAAAMQAEMDRDMDDPEAAAAFEQMITEYLSRRAPSLGIRVTATGYESTPTIELTWALILASARPRCLQADSDTRKSMLAGPRSEEVGFAHDSALEGAVTSEPVSEPKFPVRWENTGYSLIFGSISPNLSSKSQS